MMDNDWEEMMIDDVAKLRTAKEEHEETTPT